MTNLPWYYIVLPIMVIPLFFLTVLRFSWGVIACLFCLLFLPYGSNFLDPYHLIVLTLVISSLAYAKQRKTEPISRTARSLAILVGLMFGWHVLYAVLGYGYESSEWLYRDIQWWPLLLIPIAKPTEKESRIMIYGAMLLIVSLLAYKFLQLSLSIQTDIPFIINEQKNFAALYSLGILLPVLGSFCMNKSGIMRKPIAALLGWAVFSIGLAFIFLTSRVISISAILIGLLPVLFLVQRARFKRTFFLRIAVLVLLVIVMTQLPLFFPESFNRIIGYQNELSSEGLGAREGVYLRGWKAFLSNPIIGNGTPQQWTGLTVTGAFLSGHSTVIDILGSYGIFYGIIFCLQFFIFLSSIIRAYRIRGRLTAGQFSLVIGMLGAVLASLVMVVLNPYWQNIPEASVFSYIVIINILILIDSWSSPKIADKSYLGNRAANLEHSSLHIERETTGMAFTKSTSSQ